MADGLLVPDEMAIACEKTGLAKAGRSQMQLLVLGFLAGAFIAFGAVFMTIVVTGAGDMPFGIVRLFAGVVFSLGLILVIISGAELFTGDALMIIARVSGRISTASLLRAWLLVYMGNIGGAVATAFLVFLSGQHEFAGGMVGKTALSIATAKAALPTFQLFVLAVLCNVLVCLAVWMSLGGRSVVDKVVVIVPPIAAFVAAGFEHSIANLYFLPYGLMLKYWGSADFWMAIGQDPTNWAALSIDNTMHNIAVATVGNLLGGSVMVGLVYWFVYLRGRT